MKTLGEKTKRTLQRIQKRMEEKHITQAQLGKKLGMKQYEVSRMLQGKPAPTLDQLYDIAEALSTTVEFLLLIRHSSLRDLKEEDRELLLAYDQADDETKRVIARLLNR